jgi:hypothetical protein
MALGVMTSRSLTMLKKVSCQPAAIVGDHAASRRRRVIPLEKYGSQRMPQLYLRLMQINLGKG